MVGACGTYVSEDRCLQYESEFHSRLGNRQLLKEGFDTCTGGLAA